MRKLLVLLLLLPLVCFANVTAPPLDYDLHLYSIPGKNQRTMICFHGYGGNFQIANILKSFGVIDATLISFNFPDHGIRRGDRSASEITFGTINELLPAFYVIKKIVVEEGLQSIDLYGFSAGGGAVVNVIAILNITSFDPELKKLGIEAKEKKMILDAIQKGVVILDAPLKSMEEIIDLRGSTPELEWVAKNYRESDLRPIDSLKNLRGLSLNAIIYFQNPDEIIFNRDDALFVERFREANKNGNTWVITGNEGGHISPHMSLWRFYQQKIQEL